MPTAARSGAPAIAAFAIVSVIVGKGWRRGYQFGCVRPRAESRQQHRTKPNSNRGRKPAEAKLGPTAVTSELHAVGFKFGSKRNTAGVRGEQDNMIEGGEYRVKDVPGRVENWAFLMAIWLAARLDREDRVVGKARDAPVLGFQPICTAGKNRAINTAMIAIATKSSIRVKPALFVIVRPLSVAGTGRRQPAIPASVL